MEQCFFPEDLVIGQSKNGRTRYAIVERTAGFFDVNKTAFSDEDSDAAQDVVDNGYVSLSWYPEGSREVVSESKLQLVDRASLPHDVIRRKSDKKVGTIIDISVICDAVIVGMDKVIKGIDANSFHQIYPLIEGDYITYGPWLGRIKQAMGSLILRFSNGARGRLSMEADGCDLLEDLCPHASDRGSFSETGCPFYPGQLLSGQLKAFKEIEWLQGELPKDNRAKVFVEQLKLHSIKVHWIQRAFTPSQVIPVSEGDDCNINDGTALSIKTSENSDKSDRSTMEIELNLSKNPDKPPPAEVSGDHLQHVHRLCRFWKGNIRLGDRFMYNLTEADVAHMKTRMKPNKKPKRAKRSLAARTYERKQARTSHFVGGSSANIYHECEAYQSVKREISRKHNLSSDGSSSDDNGSNRSDNQNDHKATLAPAPKLKTKTHQANTFPEITNVEEDVVFEEMKVDGQLKKWSESSDIGTLLTDQKSIKLTCHAGKFEVEFFGSPANGFSISIRNTAFPPKVQKKLSEILRKRLLCFRGWRRSGYTCNVVVVKLLNILREFLIEQDLANSETINVPYEYQLDNVTTSGVMDKEGSQLEVEMTTASATKQVANNSNETKTIEKNICEKHYFSSLIATKRQVGRKCGYSVDEIVAIEVCATHTMVTIEWQDGTQSENVPTTQLVHVNHIDDNDFCPGDFLYRENAEAGTSSFLHSDVYGVVLAADNENRMVVVQWFKLNSSSNKVEKLAQEELSVYEVSEHPDFRFRVSDFVVRLCSLSDKEAVKTNQVIGELLKVTNEGKLLVHWSDGTECEIFPQEALLIDPDEVDSLLESTFIDSDLSTTSSDLSEGSWETLDSGDDSSLAQNPSQSQQELDKISSVTSDETEFSSNKENSQLHDTIVVSSVIDEIVSTVSSREDNEKILGVEEIAPDDDNLASIIMMTPGETDIGCQFYSDPKVPSNHYYLSVEFQPKNMKIFMKAVKRDLYLLQSLPSGIFVKTYENRMDLLSVLFEGPHSTPYEDGLFAFDVQLPWDYPNIPPRFHYVSYTSRLNPNLYTNGKVCVSLLGTWVGKGNEVWSKDSNLLQVLISIQGLILNSEPYFNEAGYEGQRGTAEGIQNSRCYNEMVILRLVQHMAAFIFAPPEAFLALSIELCKTRIPSLIRRVNHIIRLSQDLLSDSFLPCKKQNVVMAATAINGNGVSYLSNQDTVIDLFEKQSKNEKIGFSVDYPLLPVSKGGLISLRTKLQQLVDFAQKM
ncbi:(E3-independent) E2 ubiquitin-conjugating enzyme UBE2O-like isoform X1 [Clavelina lepadiformis]|uniref:(E3-independent) E2 ubiquitin-conjugating enzyme UBE2O-like isoform X1 n=1 Tax=Clavelina lepadiformis TaxID=159417 RepID=UPI004041424F